MSPEIRRGDMVNGRCSAYYGGEFVEWPFYGEVEDIDGDEVFVVGDDGEGRTFLIDAVEFRWRDPNQEAST